MLHCNNAFLPVAMLHCNMELRMRTLSVPVLLMVMLAAPNALALERVMAFGSTGGENPGDLDMYEHVPTGVTGALPVVVLLHGCSQTAVDHANQAGWVTLADRFGFALVVAGQRGANNQGLCFNWFQPGDITRGSGEALSIANMVARFSTAHTMDPARVFVTGLSSGGAMTAVMLAAYPEVFAGGGVVAGVPYRCAESLNDAFSCMGSGRALAAQQWGDLVRNAYPAHTGARPRLSIWHGTADGTVNVSNADNMLAQWKNVLGLDAPTTSDSNGTHAWQQWTSNNQAVLEDHRISGMDHGTPVDPGAGPEQCGTAAAFMLDVNVCSSLWLARFFGLAPAMTADAGVGPPPDAGSPRADAGTTPGMDAGIASDAAIPAVDAAVSPDAATGGTGDPPPPDDSNCACAGTSGAALPAGMVLGLVLLVVTRRRTSPR